MRHIVLGIGYEPGEYAAVQALWSKYSIRFHFVNGLPEAVGKLKGQQYACVTICSDSLDYNPYIKALRKISSAAILVLSPRVEVHERAELVRQMASQYIIQTNHIEDVAASGKDSIRYYLDQKEKEGPVTTFQYGGLTLFEEYREVRVWGREIDLTPREFDLLHLLLTNPQRALYFDTILRQVWGDDYMGGSTRVITNLMSKLRMKLKQETAFLDAIKSIHGRGYKFDPN